MGEVIFRSGIAPRMIGTLDNWLGRLPGRLGLLSVIGGTLLSTLTGSSAGTVAILGSTLVPDMEKRGYKKPMSLGPILGSGGLALMIPPSGLAVFTAVLAEVSVGRTLIGIIVPGLLMAATYAIYIIGRASLQPHLAPRYEPPLIPFSTKVMDTFKYVAPVSVIVFLVVGVIFLGIATPTEAAATGSAGAFLLAAAYGKLTWPVFRETMTASLGNVIMVLTIMMGALSYGQILAFSGATRGLAEFVLALALPPVLIVAGMMATGILLGMFAPGLTVIMITVPLFVPVIRSLGLDAIWFVIMLMLVVEMAQTSPPFGLSLFVMKGVAPPDTTMGDIYWAAIPFLLCDALVLILLLIFPSLALWLPGMM